MQRRTFTLALCCVAGERALAAVLPQKPASKLDNPKPGKGKIVIEKVMKTEEEWKQVLETQSWPKDQIPENDKKLSFICWK